MRRFQARSGPGSVRRRAGSVYGLLLGGLALCGGCDAGGLVVGAPRAFLEPGLYTYDTWTDDGWEAWWGYVDLRIEPGGTIRGSYRLPDQCSDSFGFPADCVGRVGGRVYADGTVRFGFDEGWLRHEGKVNRYSEVLGFWNTRLLGASASGEFELVPY